MLYLGIIEVSEGIGHLKIPRSLPEYLRWTNSEKEITFHVQTIIFETDVPACKLITHNTLSLLTNKANLSSEYSVLQIMCAKKAGECENFINTPEVVLGTLGEAITISIRDFSDNVLTDCRCKVLIFCQV